MIHVTDKNFEEEVLKADGRVLVDFFATWCGPCKMLSPILEKMEPEYTGTVKFCKLDTDEAAPIAISYGVSAIPTVILFENGKVVDKFIGLSNENEIREFLYQKK